MKFGWFARRDFRQMEFKNNIFHFSDGLKDKNSGVIILICAVCKGPGLELQENVSVCVVLLLFVMWAVSPCVLLQPGETLLG